MIPNFYAMQTLRMQSTKLKSAALLWIMLLFFSTSATAFQGQMLLPTPSTGSVDKAELQHLSDSVANILLQRDLIPGMTVALAQNGEIIFSKGYGKADLELNVPSSSEDIYRIGSITKQFTAALILRLAEEGKLSLDDPITKYLPDYPTQGNLVTIKHLLNHTSGIKGIRGRMADDETKQQLRLDLTDAEINALFADAPFDFKPGEDQQYSNSGYILLGQIISKISGMPYKDYVEQTLLQPLGLNHTGFDDGKSILPNRITGYESEDKVRINAPFINMNLIGGAGAFYSTASDLLKWTHLLHSGKVISPESLEKMTAPTQYGNGKIAGYGLGLSLNEIGNYKMVYHTGRINGFSAILSHYPDAGLSIAILTNTGDGEVIAAVEKGLAKKALGVKVLDLPVKERKVKPFLGSYTYQSGENQREIRIFNEEKGLMAQVVGGKPFRLLFQGETLFIPEGNQDMKFVFNKKNLEIHDGPWEKMIATKIK